MALIKKIVLEKINSEKSYKDFNEQCTPAIVRLCIVTLLFIIESLYAQVLSTNGAVSINNTSGTFIVTNTLENNSGSTFDNAGTITAASITNAGTLQNNGTYNISATLTNTGTFTAGTSTVDFNGSGSQSVPALDYYNLNFSTSGTKTFAGGTTGIAGTFSITGATADATTNSSTIHFNGTSAQTVNPITYYNIEFSNGGTKTISGSVAVNNDVTINSGATLLVDAGGTLAVHNNIDNDGTFNNDGTVTYAP